MGRLDESNDADGLRWTVHDQRWQVVDPVLLILWLIYCYFLLNVFYMNIMDEIATNMTIVIRPVTIQVECQEVPTTIWLFICINFLLIFLSH